MLKKIKSWLYIEQSTMDESNNESHKGGELIATNVSALMHIHVRILYAFLCGKYGRGKFKLVTPLENSNKVFIYLYNHNDAMMAELSGDLNTEIYEVINWRL